MWSTSEVGISLRTPSPSMSSLRARGQPALDEVLRRRRAPCRSASRRRAPAAACSEQRIDRLQAHLVVERADHELADRDRAAVREERAHAQVGIDAAHAATCRRARRRTRGSSRSRCPWRAGRSVTGRPWRGGIARRALRADRAQVRGDLVGEHFLQAEAEQVRCVAAVGPRDHVAAEARRAARTAVAAGAAVDEPGADRARSHRCRRCRPACADRSPAPA